MTPPSFCVPSSCVDDSESVSWLFEVSIKQSFFFQYDGLFCYKQQGTQTKDSNFLNSRLIQG